jgi:hypothetical protein
VRAVHLIIGWAIVIAFAALMLAGAVTRLVRRRDPGSWFWVVVAVVQVAVGLQLIGGVILLATGGRQPWLHYAYGVFPVLALALAHVLSRSGDRPAWVNFAWASFFCFGLTLRALMTGLGIG